MKIKMNNKLVIDENKPPLIIADSAPQIPVESLICGTPVVSFDVGNLKEVITEKNDGFIIPNSNTYDMAEKILHILNSKSFYSYNQKKKRSLKVVKSYSLKKFIKDLNNFFNLES